jgi:endonuclease III
MSEDRFSSVAAVLLKSRGQVEWEWIREGRDKKGSNKFLLVSILDYQVKSGLVSDRVRVFAEKFLGDPEALWETICSEPIEVWNTKFSEYRLHRFPKAHERVWKIGRKVLELYAGDARRIWDGTNVSVARQRLLELGAGEQISRMIAGALYDVGWITGGGDVKADVHVTRVIGRVFSGGSLSTEEVTEITRRMNPENPWLLDKPLFDIGQKICHTKTPKCDKCPLYTLCNFTARNPNP